MSRIVIKIGSNILADRTGGLNQKRIAGIAQDVADVKKAGNETVIVSSGAVAAGMVKLGLREKPKEIRLKQAAAAVGQSSLMWAYERSFSRLDEKVAQILLTRDAFSDRMRYLNAKNTLMTLIERDVIPVINENDTVSTEEIKFGDNDQLAALVSGMIEADRLVILSDVEGLYTADPRTDPGAELIRVVQEITPEFIAMAGGSGSAVGTGGMYSKVLAAKKAVSHGTRVHIISGKERGLLASVLAGNREGTEFIPQSLRISSRKGWISYAVKAKGNIIIDPGAVHALEKGGKSLLPSGIVRVEGNFDVGDAVYCIDQAGERIAKGIVNYSSRDVEQVRGKKSGDIEAVLGFKYSDEVIHRDNLVVLKKT